MKALKNLNPMLHLSTGFRDEIRLRHDNISNCIGKGSFIINTLIKVVVLLICAGAFSLLTMIIDGAFDTYCDIIIPIFLSGVITIILGDFLRAPSFVGLSVSILTLLGSALQSLLFASKLLTVSSMTAYSFYAICGSLAGVIAIPAIRFLFKHKTLSIYASLLLSIALYIAVIAFGSNINGTKAWLFGFQITEITKLLYIFTTASILSAKAETQLKRFIASTVVLFIHTLFLAISNEFGTLLIMVAVYCVLNLIYLKSLKSFTISILIIAIMATSVLAISKICYNDIYEKSEEQISQTAMQEEPSAIKKTMADVFYKIDNRVKVVINPELSDSNDAANQAKSALDSLAISGWFGSGLFSYTPVFSSDFIYVYTVMKLGVIFALLSLILTAGIFIVGMIRTARVTEHSEGALSFGFLTAIASQSFISAASALVIIPTVGVPFTFLSSGGTHIVLSILMIYFVIYAMRKPLNTISAAKPKKKTKEVI